MRQLNRPWLSYLILGGFLAVQVPFRLAELQLARAGLLALGAAVFLALGIRAVRRRTAGRPAVRNPAVRHPE